MACLLFLSVEYVLLLRGEELPDVPLCSHSSVAVFALYSQHRMLKKLLPGLLIFKASVMLVQLVLHLTSLHYDTQCDGVLSTASIYAYTYVISAEIHDDIP